MVRGMIAALKLPVWMQDVLITCTGPLTLRYKWAIDKNLPMVCGNVREELVTDSRRGILMGLPTTWFMLCLTHLFWVDYATSAVTDLNERSRLRSRVAICGDDLIAHWPKSVSERYHTVLGECYGVISKSKHYRLEAAGVFTEKVFRVRVQ